MTIPKAVSLVLQSSVFENSGDIFVLDMGNTGAHSDLARKILHWPDLPSPGDVEVVFTGLRPGEKLYEELSQDVEAVVEMPIPKSRALSPQKDA
jgi:FlaA1/EpsC-like NDP-sugar epimerase